MEFLVLTFAPFPRVTIESHLFLGENEIVVQDVRYRLVGSNQMFEWLFNQADDVIGIEIHITPDDSVWTTVLLPVASLGFDLSDQFPRYWFGSHRDGLTKCFGDWEDYYYKAEAGQILFAFRLHMLNEDVIEKLKLTCSSTTGPAKQLLVT